MTPGTHPHMVRMKTISIEPQPLSITARGGIMIARRTRKQPMNDLNYLMQSSEKNMSWKNKTNLLKLIFKPATKFYQLTTIKCIVYV